LRRASPDKLAAFALAVLHVNIAAGILQTAVLELAVHVNTVIQNHVLVLKCLILKAIHEPTRTLSDFQIDS
jgi:hypothetical protein